MEKISYYFTGVALVTVTICWFVFAGTFLLRKKPGSAPESKRAPSSFFGLVLQGIAFGLVWGCRRTPILSPLVESQFVLNVVFQLFAILLTGSSVLLATSAIRELGKQWSLQARLVEGHKLITTGVYQIVRHPIYTAMFGMLLGTGFVLSNWIAAVAAIVIFLIGTRIRTVSEEKLLSEAFGEEFSSWKAKVPALIPFTNVLHKRR